MSPDGRQARCRECFRSQYETDRDGLHAKIMSRQLPLRHYKESMLAAYLLEHPCVDCGERDLRVLDLDHRDPMLKRLGIGQMLAGGWSWRAVLLEMEKCDVRCANCHRKRTAEQQSWWKQAYEAERRAARAAESQQRLSQVFSG